MRRFKFATLALSVSLSVLTQAGNAAQQALQIDKTDDTGLNYFMVPHNATLDEGIGSTLTVEAWVKPNEMSADNACGASYQIINKEVSYEIALRNRANADTGEVAPGTFEAALWAKDGIAWDWVSTGVVAPAGRWTHVALTWDGIVMRLFVNGKFAVSDDRFSGPDGTKGVLNLATLADPPNPAEPLRIGRRHNTAPCHQMFDGLIDEVRISKTIRYTEAGYTVPTKEFTPDADTVALYHFNESSTAEADVKPLKDKFTAAGIREDPGQNLQDASIDPPLDIKGASKDASSFANHGALLGKAVLVAADTPITE